MRVAVFLFIFWSESIHRILRILGTEHYSANLLLVLLVCTPYLVLIWRPLKVSSRRPCHYLRVSLGRRLVSLPRVPYSVQVFKRTLSTPVKVVCCELVLLDHRSCDLVRNSMGRPRRGSSNLGGEIPGDTAAPAFATLARPTSPSSVRAHPSLQLVLSD